MKKQRLLLFAVVAVLIALCTVFRSGKNHSVAGNAGDGVTTSELSNNKESHQTSKIEDQSDSKSKKLTSSASQAGTTQSAEKSQRSYETDKFKSMSVEEEISKVEKLYPSVLNRKGFTEHEAEVILRLQIEEIKSPRKGEESSIDKASKELGLTQEKKALLNEAFDEVFLGLTEYTTDDVAACMSKRLTGISTCTKSVLDEYLRDMALSLESDIFVINQRIGELTRAATKKAIETCNETPERANYQFRLVFVECDPI